MMPLHFLSRQELDSLVRKRAHETKLGERVQLVDACSDVKSLGDQLQQLPAPYVLIGFPEDIGVRANYGRAGAYSAWQPALESILNIQSNAFLQGDELIVLGHVRMDDLMEQASKLSTKKSEDVQELRRLTSLIDQRIAPIIECILRANKKIIAVGGGHNNAYPLIKGMSAALAAKINVLNLDAHSDFRPLEGRHSGNGFSYAYEEGFIQHYHALGIHENYCTDAVVEKFNSAEALHLYTYEEVFLRDKHELTSLADTICESDAAHAWGFEIDLDSIQNIPSSAKTSSGMLPIDVRKFMYDFVKKCEPHYLHIAEGAPVLSHIKTDNKTGKLIAYLISDFIKALK